MSLRGVSTNGLVAVAGTVLVVAAQVAVIRWRCAEEDGGRQVIAARFAELVHLPGDTRLDGHTVTCQGESRLLGRNKVATQV